MSATTYTVGATYRVRVRNWDFTRNAHKPSNADLISALPLGGETAGSTEVRT